MSGRSRAPHNEQVTLDLDGFLRDGYVVIRGAVAASTASTCRQAIWDALGGQGIRADEPATWPPLVHLDNLDGEPFTAAGSAPALADADLWQPSVLSRRTAHATGRAGDVYLCHPFIVHTATWPHRGGMPRMIAQPAVHVRDGFALDGTDPPPSLRRSSPASPKPNSQGPC